MFAGGEKVLRPPQGHLNPSRQRRPGLLGNLSASSLWNGKATLGTTFASAVAAQLSAGASLPQGLAAQLPFLSVCFLSGLGLLLASFELGGWARSNALGWATTVLAVAGLCGALFVLWPFLRVSGSLPP